MTRYYPCRNDRMKYKIFIIKLRRTRCLLAAAATDKTKFLLSCATFNLYKLKAMREELSINQLISSNLRSVEMHSQFLFLIQFRVRFN